MATNLPKCILSYDLSVKNSSEWMNEGVIYLTGNKDHKHTIIYK